MSLVSSAHTPAARSSSSAPLISRRGGLLLVVVAATLLGLGLRLAAARDDLWLDEIWTLDLLRSVGSAAGIFWLGHDNNHILNSLYLYAVGPNAPPLLQRGLSIVLGAASIAAAGFVQRRRGPVATASAVLLFALAVPMVNAGSEARGYAGLVLFTLLALASVESWQATREVGARRMLGGATGLGLLSHFTFVIAAGLLAAWSAWRAWRRDGSPRRAADATLTLFGPALWASLAVGLVVAAGTLRHPFTINAHDPFTWAGFRDGYGGLIGSLVGLPRAAPSLAGLVIVLGVMALAARRLRDDPRLPLYAAALLAFPALVVLARVPNTQFTRYYLVPGTLFLLLLCDLIGGAFREGGWRRVVAAGALALVLAGQATGLAAFIATGRGEASALVARMAASGATAYAGDHPFRVPTVVGFYAGRSGVRLEPVPSDRICVHPPDWYVSETTDGPASLTLGPCRIPFVRDSLYPAYPVSGSAWSLYRRVPSATVTLRPSGG